VESRASQVTSESLHTRELLIGYEGSSEWLGPLWIPEALASEPEARGEPKKTKRKSKSATVKGNSRKLS
jgi:hypothetical protein